MDTLFFTENEKNLVFKAHTLSIANPDKIMNIYNGLFMATQLNTA
ncbi:MAG: hypothetical protein ACJAT7_000888 [Psychromonas sp.]|jgi:hypothetical protein